MHAIGVMILHLIERYFDRRSRRHLAKVVTDLKANDYPAHLAELYQLWRHVKWARTPEEAAIRQRIWLELNDRAEVNSRLARQPIPPKALQPWN